MTTTMAPSMTLIEQAEVLKQELGLEGKEGTAVGLIKEAAWELEVSVEGRPISEVAAECVAAMPMAESA